MTKNDILRLLEISKNVYCPSISNDLCEDCIIYKQCKNIWDDNTKSSTEKYVLRKKNVDMILSRIPQEMIFEVML